MTRRDRIAAVLAEHPDGLSTPQIAELSGIRARTGQLTLTRCGDVLRFMERRGEVTRSGHVPATYHNTPTLVWRLTDAALTQSKGDPVTDREDSEAKAFERYRERVTAAHTRYRERVEAANACRARELATAYAVCFSTVQDACDELLAAGL